MNSLFDENYDLIRSGRTGFYEQKRGLISVHGKEAVPFLNGMITNDVAKLEDGAQMLAAFPNAQGRLLAVVRVIRQDDKFLFETEDATREKVYNNLFRFTFAGDFFVEDISDQCRFLTVFDRSFLPMTQPFIELESPAGADYFVCAEETEDFLTELKNIDAIEVSDELYETLRIESGIPKYGVDMDETTIVPELGLEGLISYNKGCYIGQEIIARIHFRGHVAKQLTGLTLSEPAGPLLPEEACPKDGAAGTATELLNRPTLAGLGLTSADGKNAGRITSSGFSPKINELIALGYVRYDYLAEGTELAAGDLAARVTPLPFV